MYAPARLPSRMAVPVVPSLSPCKGTLLRLQNRAPGKRQGDRPSITGNILAHTQRTDFNRPEPQAALGPEQRGIYANPFSPPSLEILANHLRSNTQQDTLLSSPDVCQAPKSILRSTSGGSGTPSVRSAVSDSSMRTAISNASTKSERSAESLKSDQKRASSQANDIKAKIDKLERANRALEPQISHYQQIISNVESFEKKNKAMQEIKDRRVQQIDKQRSCMFCLAKRVARLSLFFSPALITPPPLQIDPENISNVDRRTGVMSRSNSLEQSRGWTQRCEMAHRLHGSQDHKISC